MLSENCYRTENWIKDNEVYYFFISKGLRDIDKAIHYVLIGALGGKPIFNLGFGDVDVTTKELIDTAIDNNGDHYKVFYTVLNTIPSFFQIYPKAYIMVRGSDSRPWFRILCKLWCKKKCSEGNCKNENRRLKIYRNYVDKHFELLTREYCFYGGVDIVNGQLNMSEYQQNDIYDYLVIQKA